MIQITLERKALNANGRPTENEFQNFEFHFKSLLEKEVNAERSTQSVISSFMPNRNLLPDSDVYLVSSSISNTGIDIYE
ncbi:hypothetical protein T02_6888 [Trichinella nativa]|uniref:Uncharacterized protein n=1 Tax=Trichinella nativa TaxID=6335 RepID=A0A0V1LLV9_9BILA|nr:hypothetical protein T02_2357 [Trichinella nativa]KRZ60435.1 hypothetical protein T02_4534 [Trichinella nativa]KRZ60457.1 hypothetical protein T02_6888 [Trichinella nativa]KRZ92510.1 hypothetical protein T08_7198 [Trichinella sp. T8]